MIKSHYTIEVSITDPERLPKSFGNRNSSEMLDLTFKRMVRGRGTNQQVDILIHLPLSTLYKVCAVQADGV